MKLSDQRKLAKLVSRKDKNTIADHCCRRGVMSGSGFMDVLKSIGNAVGPVVKELGPTVLKEIILPLVKKKMEGNGIRLAGGGLRLAGQRTKRK